MAQNQLLVHCAPSLPCPPSLIFDCPVVVSFWKEIESLLLRIDPSPVTEQERIFGI